MTAFLQFHNAAKLGWVPLGERPFLERTLAITTRVRSALAAVGGTVYLIAKLPRPTTYYLWESFTVEHVEERGGVYQAWGPGRQLVPPQPLSGPAFDDFRRDCAYFVGFRPIDGHAFLDTLRGLAAEFARDDVNEEAEAFCSRLIASFPSSGDARYYRAFVRGRLARQDAAEALRLGTEHRLAPDGGTGDAVAAPAAAR